MLISNLFGLILSKNYSAFQAIVVINKTTQLNYGLSIFHPALGCF